jgi:hypothetical protein
LEVRGGVDLGQIADCHRGHRRAERRIARHAALEARRCCLRPRGRNLAQGLDLEHRPLALRAATVALPAQRVHDAEHAGFRAAQRDQRPHARRGGGGVVLVVVQRAPEHRAVDADHPADGHSDVIDFVDGTSPS